MAVLALTGTGLNEGDLRSPKFRSTKSLVEIEALGQSFVGY